MIHSRRVVKFQSTDDTFGLASSGARLPVQWTAWLSHTRPDPPNLEELERDAIRQQSLEQNVRVLQLRDNGQASAATPSNPAPQEITGLLLQPGRPYNPVSRKTMESVRVPTTPDSDYQPESWTPQSRSPRNRQKKV